ncbi:hypothetical protein [Streptomyces apocyni]|uniref:hypothetical protein n=1 Tax=Streptomyces apocyni TaxID=2654677 RepID=UPI0012EA1535|nr:hypothetical protein [Streptomyces apocyni]
MRRTRSLRPARTWFAAVCGLALLFVLPSDAVSQPSSDAIESHARVRDEPRPFGAICRIEVDGSDAVAYCHNPYPETDHVRLHIECARWWDIDTDGAPVAVEPAMTERLAGRCWKEIDTVWVSHAR